MKKLLAVALLGLLGLTACGAGVDRSNRDPKLGPVYLYSNTTADYKICDGPNLLYYGYHTLSTVANATECAVEPTPTVSPG